MSRVSSKIVFSIFVLLFTSSALCQTSRFGEYEIYTRETSGTGIGYLTMEFNLPQSIGGDMFTARGASLTQSYDISTIVTEALSKSSQFKLSLEGNFSIGAALGEQTFQNYQDVYPNSTVKYYIGTVEFFSIYLVPEFTQVIGHGNALTVNVGIGLLNLGGSFAYLENGEFEKHSVGTVNIIPFIIKPTLTYDFGRTGVGLQIYINPFNFLSYNYGSESLYKESRGFKSKNSFMKKFEVRLFITY